MHHSSFQTMFDGQLIVRTPTNSETPEGAVILEEWRAQGKKGGARKSLDSRATLVHGIEFREHQSCKDGGSWWWDIEDDEGRRAVRVSELCCEAVIGRPIG